MKDRINEKRVLIPSKKTCWEIHLYLLEMPSSGCYSACQKIFDVTPHHHITLVLSSLTSLHRASHPSITLHSPHYSSFCLLDTSFVVSNMTVMVWERKKEKKKWVKEAGRAMAAMISVTGNRAAVSNRRR